MLWEALSTARDLGRLHEIASVLIRHGLGDAVRRLGIAGILERWGKKLHWDLFQGLSSKKPEEHVREALEDLGPSFVKVGQILAGRGDLLPPEWTRELSRLQERAPTVPYEDLREQLEQDLGAPPTEVFADFDTEPLAAASIAQVHRATLKDGQPVVLKIRRPGIEEKVEADMRLLARLAEIADAEMPELRRYRPRSLARQLARSLRDELDMRVEARSAARMAVNLRELVDVVVPTVYAEYTSERLLVMDFLDGPSVGAWLEGDREGANPKRIAAKGADAVLHMVFVDGMFHADPHPGNLILLEAGRIGLLDFGMVGRLSEPRRIEFLSLLRSVVERREDDVVDILLGWSMDREVELDALHADVAAFLDRYYGLALSEIDATEMLSDVMRLLRENDLFLPGDLALLLKVFVTLESFGRRLDPDFVVARHVEPFARRAYREYHSPFAIARRGVRELSHLLSGLPRDLRRLTGDLRRGRLRMDIDLKGLDDFAVEIDKSANRLTIGMVTSSLIVGTAIVFTRASGPEVFGLPVFSLLGFLSAIAFGVWLLWSIARSGRR